MRQLLIGVFLISASLASAQEFRATIRGTVFDPNKAVVPGAQLMLRNVETSVERQATSDGEGHYLFEFVVPGLYSLTTHAVGFKTDTRAGIQLSLADNSRLDIILAIGQASETIEVTATPSGVEVESSSVGTLLQQKVIDDLPIKGHSPFEMWRFAPGVAGEDRYQDARLIDQQTPADFTANGAPVSTGDSTVDGIPVQSDLNRGAVGGVPFAPYIPSYIPSTEAISAFKMQTATLPAEYGHTSGSIRNVVIKSGTNDLHGSAFYYVRNSFFDANSFFSNKAGQPLLANRTNTFGGTVGGPVYIPRLYNGKNRTFFFASYEHMNNPQVGSGFASVPTAKMHQGDFSEFGTIYNPFSTGPGVTTRSPFPGNVIPASMMDPVGKAILGYLPLPNTAPTSASTPWKNNFASSFSYPTIYGMWTWKFDQKITDKQQMFIRLNYGSGWLHAPGNGDINTSSSVSATASNIAMANGRVDTRPNRGAAIGYTITLTPTVVADFRIGMIRGAEQQTPWAHGFDLASLGFPASFVKSVQLPEFPTIGFNDGMAPMGSGSASGVYCQNWGEVWATENSLLVSRGKHTLKFGVDIRLERGNFFQNDNPSGTFSFRSNETGGPNAAAPSGGFSIASLLLGYGGSGSLPSATGQSWVSPYYGLFAQDDYRVTSKLTLNLGVRWEYYGPRVERYNRMVRGFLLNTPSPLNVPGMNLVGGIQYAGVNGVPTGLFNSGWKNFAPRVGFAYAVASNLSIRGGYTMGYVPITTGIQTTGYSQTTPWVTSTDGGITVANRLGNPFPSGLLAPVGNSQGLLSQVGQSVSYSDPNDVIPVLHTWQISVQRALPSNSVLSVAYVGSHGSHLKSTSTNLDQVPFSAFTMGSALSQAVANPLFGYLPTSSTIAGATVQRAQLLRPYPQFTGVTRVEPAYGNSSYESFQLSWEKRMANGLTGVVAYTFSKNLDDIAAPQDIANRRVARELASFDVPQRLTIAMAWDLPIGRGRHFFTGMGKVTDMIVGGWTLSANSTLQYGEPLGFGVTGGTYFANITRALLVGDPSAGVSGSIVSRLNNYFNTAAFALPPNYTLGNVAPRVGWVRNPGMTTLDAVLRKQFPIYERLKMDLWLSAFNALNHTIFSAPGTSVGSASFGIISSQANYGRQLEVSAKLVF